MKDETEINVNEKIKRGLNKAVPAIDRYDGARERLLANGSHNLIAMAELFHSPSEIDVELGYTGAISHILAGRTRSSRIPDKAASMWLALNAPEALPKRPERAPEPETAPPATYPEPAIPAPDETGTAVALMVVCPAERVVSLRNMLSMMGCEVEAI